MYCAVVQFSFEPPVQSVIDFPLSALRQMQRLNLLLSASHLDHKKSCSQHANQYPSIHCSAARDSQEQLLTKSRAERAPCYLIELPVAKL